MPLGHSRNNIDISPPFMLLELLIYTFGNIHLDSCFWATDTFTLLLALFLSRPTPERNIWLLGATAPLVFCLLFGTEQVVHGVFSETFYEGLNWAFIVSYKAFIMIYHYAHKHT